MQKDGENRLTRGDFFRFVSAVGGGLLILHFLPGCSGGSSESIPPEFLDEFSWKQFFDGSKTYSMNGYAEELHPDIANRRYVKVLELMEKAYRQESGRILYPLGRAESKIERPNAVVGGRLLQKMNENEGAVLWWSRALFPDGYSIFLLPPADKTNLHASEACSFEAMVPLLVPEGNSYWKEDGGISCVESVQALRITPPYFITETVRYSTMEGKKVWARTFSGLVPPREAKPALCDLSGDFSGLKKIQLGVPGDAAFLSAVGGPLRNGERIHGSGAAVEILEGEDELEYRTSPLDYDVEAAAAAMTAIIRKAATGEDGPFAWETHGQAIPGYGLVTEEYTGQMAGQWKEEVWRSVTEAARGLFWELESGKDGHYVCVSVTEKALSGVKSRYEWRLLATNPNDPSYLQTCAVFRNGAWSEAPTGYEISEQEKVNLPGMLQSRYPRSFASGVTVVSASQLPPDSWVHLHDGFDAGEIVQAWRISGERMKQQTLIGRFLTLDPNDPDQIILAKSLKGGLRSDYDIRRRNQYSHVNAASVRREGEFGIQRQLFSPFGMSAVGTICHILENPLGLGKDSRVAAAQLETGFARKLEAAERVAIPAWGEIHVYRAGGLWVGDPVGLLQPGDLVPLGEDHGDFICISGDFGENIVGGSSSEGSVSLVVRKEDLIRTEAFILAGERLESLKRLYACLYYLKGERGKLTLFLPEGMNNIQVDGGIEVFLQTAVRTIRDIDIVNGKRDAEWIEVLRRMK